jgi:hypothetical protein
LKNNLNKETKDLKKENDELKFKISKGERK